MPDLEMLRSLGERIQPPALSQLEETARRRGRRATVAVVGGGIATAVLAVGGVVALQSVGEDRSLPDPVTPVTPSPNPDLTPTPGPDESPTHASDTAMRPREVVQADNAQFLFGGVSADDPDFRMSVWTAECTWCPKTHEEDRTRPFFNAMAVTTDGWETVTYRRPPMGAGRPFYVHSPAPGVLLVVDDSNGGEWLVRQDASAEPLPRFVEDRPDAGSRQWFECLSGQDRLTWCAFDPLTEAVYEASGPWSAVPGSDLAALSPQAGHEPWGRELLDPDTEGPLTAWWYADGVRRTRVLAESFPRAGRAGPVRGADEGDLVYWTHVTGEDRMRFYVGDDLGESWRTIEQTYPDDTAAEGQVTVLATPEGAVILRELLEAGGIARTRIWRLDSLEEGEWVLAHDTGGSARWADTGEERPLTVIGSQLWSGSLSSDDDGRTWTEVNGWR